MSIFYFKHLLQRYKHYYFYDDDDKDRHGYPDLYFKTVGLIKPMKPINFGAGNANRETSSSQSQRQTEIETKNEHVYDPKILGIWKKAVNTIIFKRIIKQYAPILIELGVDLDSDSDEDEDEEDEDDDDHNESSQFENNKTKEPKKQVFV